MLKKCLCIFIIALFGLVILKNAIANNDHGFYLDGNIGYLTTDWQKSGLFPYIVVPDFTLTFDNFKNSKGGFAYGMDVGYLINRYIGFEIGGYILPTVNAYFIINKFPNITIQGWDNITNWLAYSAGKFTMPIIHNLGIILKIGPAYRNIEFRGRDQQNNNLDLNGLSCIGGAGLQYRLSSLLSIEAQWLHVSSYSIISQNVTVPSANLFMGTLEINLSNLGCFCKF